MRKRTVTLAFVALLALVAALPLTAAQAGGRPQRFSASGIAWVASEIQGFPAGASGRYVTTEETVMAALGDSDWDLLQGASLIVSHASNARFEVDYTYGFPLITYIDSGASHGKFTLVASDGVTTYEGSYQTKLSTTPGCTIFDSGTWALNSGSVQAHGTLSVCLNFTGQTYAGPAIMEGQHN